MTIPGSEDVRSTHVYQQVGRRQLLLVIYGSPDYVLFCFVGRRLPNIENHRFICLSIRQIPSN